MNDFDFLERDITDDLIQEKREFLVKQCLQTIVRTDPITAQQVYTYHRCKNYHICANCAAMRSADEYKLWHAAGISDLVYTQFVNEKETRKFTKKLDWYRRYPLEDYIVVVCYMRDDDFALPLLHSDRSPKEIADILTNTPRGKKVTGRLFDKEVIEEEIFDDTIELITPAVLVPDADQDVLKTIHRQVLDEVELIALPDTQEIAQQYLDALKTSTLDLFRSHGISYTILYNVTKKVRLSKLEWTIKPILDLGIEINELIYVSEPLNIDIGRTNDEQNEFWFD